MIHENKRIISIVIISIALLQGLIVGARYFQSKMNLTNPLIPESLISGIMKFSIFMSTLYFFVVILNVFYLFKRKGFWSIVIFSGIILVGLALFGQKIHTVFVTSY